MIGRRSAGQRGDPAAFLRRASLRWYWMPAVVLAVGLVSLAMLVGTNRIYEEIVQRDHARVRAVDEIQLHAATAHLWIEEYVTGDAIHLDEARAGLARAEALVAALLEGGSHARATSDVKRLDDTGLRELASKIETRLGEFRELSSRRELGFGLGEPVGIGSEIDVRYDAVFGELLAGARDLGTVLAAREARNHERATLLFRSIFAGWIVIVAVSVIGLWSHERKRARAEAALRESQAQLLQAQKLDAVGRLAGGMAHDINNYLGAIRAQSELVKLKRLSGEAAAAKMDTVVQVVDKASALIERLLAFSRQEPIQPEVVDLNAIVTGGLGSMVRQLVGEDVRLETRLAPRLWSVKIDPSQVEQALVNLVVNARQAMPVGGAVTIATGNQGVDAAGLGATGLHEVGDYVWLSVSDDGPGIPEDVRDKIFDPFFTTKPTTRNSGLGLSTVHGIVEQNGGAITVECGPAGGTTFTIRLPRSHADPLPVASSTPEPEAVGLSGTLLLVEDNDELRRSTRGMIEALGYDVIEAADAEQALAVFEQVGDDVDLLITDVVMPGMSGRQLVDRLRQKRRDLKVLYTSGYTGDVILRHGIAEGDVSFLKKPFSADRLVRRIRQLLAAA